MRHERQTLLRWWDQARVGSASVGVYGCGALGSQVAVGAARLGVGRITLVDPDVLEEHNLENQVYDASDVGKPKVVALAGRIRSIDADITVTPFIGRVAAARVPASEYLFGCFDNPAARYYLAYLGVAERRPVIDGGISSLIGAVTTTIPGQTACLACEPFLPRAAPRASCSSEPLPSTYVTAAVVANLQLGQFIQLVHGRPVRSHLSVDVDRMTLYGHDFARNPECEICGGA